jgi:serine/threonine protein kinase/Tfp pilus assembly protein PilF
MIGRTLLSYRILRKVGQGSGGEAYLAEDTRLQRPVVLKFLPESLVENEHARRRFLREARLASALDHPNICTIYEINETDGLHFIVMQYAEGKTLKQVIAGEPLDTDSTLSIAIQIAAALASAHERGIIHRDMKPANVVVTNDGQVKILDFGLAKSLALPTMKTSQPIDATELTRHGAQLGTPAYMSPEQVRGEPADHRSDIFSLGVILYEMATGQSPFKSKNRSIIDVMHSVAHDQPPPVREINPQASPQLQSITERAMQKEPTSRYQTMRDALRDLKQLARELNLDLSGLSDGTSDYIYPRRERPHWLKRNLRSLGLAIVMAALAMAGLAFYLSRTRGEAIDSIAVLPFTHASNDPNTEYLSDGITESLINSLSQLPNLKVISRGSVFRYKLRDTTATPPDPLAVGHDLNVSAVLIGRLTERGDNLSISAELVDVRNDRQIWGEQYNRRLTDILAVQEEISREISEKLRSKLTGEQQKRLTKRYTEDTEAYQLYIKGRYHWNRRTEEALSKAVEYLQQAIERDPNYALAYAGLADCYNLQTIYSGIPPRDGFPRGKAAAIKAMAIDDTLAEAHAPLAYVKQTYEHDLEGAEKEFKRAIELNPSYATAHQWYGEYLTMMGRLDESIAEKKKAQELDPLSLVINTTVGWTLYFARQYDQAITIYQKALDLDPNFFRAHLFLGQVYEQKGMYANAIAEFEQAISLSRQSTEAVGALGHAYAITGRRGEAQKIIADLKGMSNQKYVDSYSIAIIHIGLGEKDQAFAWLEKGYEDRSYFSLYANVDPVFDSIRADPRFASLTRRMGLAQ